MVAEFQLLPELPQFAVDSIDLAADSLPLTALLVQQFPLLGQSVNFSLQSIFQHIKLDIRINVVLLQKRKLRLVSVQLGYFCADCKRNVFLFRPRPLKSQKIQVVNIQCPEAPQFFTLAWDSPTGIGISLRQRALGLGLRFRCRAGTGCRQPPFYIILGIACSQAVQTDELTAPGRLDGCMLSIGTGLNFIAKFP